MLIVAGCVLSFYLTRSFERPINQLMRTARAIAAGDLDQKLSLERQDELERWPKANRSMVSIAGHQLDERCIFLLDPSCVSDRLTLMQTGNLISQVPLGNGAAEAHH